MRHNLLFNLPYVEPKYMFDANSVEIGYVVSSELATDIKMDIYK